MIFFLDGGGLGNGGWHIIGMIFFWDGRIRKGGEDGVKQKENKDSI